MSTAEDDLKDFAAFVHDSISRGAASELGLAELFDLWMLQNRTDADYEDNVAAVNASINDYMKGERGTQAGEHSRQLRAKYGLSDK